MITNIPDSSKEYISNQIAKIQQNKNNSAFVINCKWRIASNIDLFGTNLDPTGKLDEDQIAQVDRLIAEFRG